MLKNPDSHTAGQKILGFVKHYITFLLKKYPHKNICLHANIFQIVIMTYEINTKMDSFDCSSKICCVV